MFSPDQLVFVAWTFRDWKTGRPLKTDYHLAQYNIGNIRTSCGMVIMSSAEQPSYAELTEPDDCKICSVCSSRAPEFSKGHFGGRKLTFRKSSVKLQKKQSHESNEEVYRAKGNAEDWKLS